MSIISQLKKEEKIKKMSERKKEDTVQFWACLVSSLTFLPPVMKRFHRGSKYLFWYLKKGQSGTWQVDNREMESPPDTDCAETLCTHYRYCHQRTVNFVFIIKKKNCKLGHKHENSWEDTGGRDKGQIKPKFLYAMLTIKALFDDMWER